VDLNPHQIEAALFAFKSPLAKGAVLADQVGLGKTIEAGLVPAEKWTEGKRRILIVCSFLKFLPCTPWAVRDKSGHPSKH
jgi:hypothetical protein